jgi:hypothetical protein
MLGWLRERGMASERKLRLFSCACCRRIWHLLGDERSRRAVEVSEGYADGAATEEERENAQRAAATAPGPGGIAAKSAAMFLARTGAMLVVDAAGQAASSPPGQDYDPARWAAEWRGQCVLVRDLFGPGVFRPVTIASSVLGWGDGAVVRLAQAIYEERAFHRMGVLADALLEAGCDDEDVLSHCRQQGGHVRGCFVLDLLLNKP